MMFEVLFVIVAAALTLFLCLGVVPLAIVELINWSEKRHK